MHASASDASNQAAGPFLKCMWTDAWNCSSTVSTVNFLASSASHHRNDKMALRSADVNCLRSVHSNLRHVAGSIAWRVNVHKLLTHHNIQQVLRRVRVNTGGVSSTAKVSVHSLVVLAEAGSKFSPRRIRRAVYVLHLPTKSKQRVNCDPPFHTSILFSAEIWLA